jgi:hypothetical protein
MLLDYSVDGNVLITNQRSSPREDRTVFDIRANTLTLFYNGHPSSYVRVPNTQLDAW